MSHRLYASLSAVAVVVAVLSLAAVGTLNIFPTKLVSSSVGVRNIGLFSFAQSNTHPFCSPFSSLKTSRHDTTAPTAIALWKRFQNVGN